MKSILITGATGFIGKQLVESLSPSTKELFILSRRNSVQRAKELFSHLPNVTVIEGNLLEPKECGISDELKLSYLRQNVTDVIHAAALYDLSATKKELYLNSLLITQNFVKLCNSFKAIEFFHQLSTYAVNLSAENTVSEEELSDAPSLDEPYSWAKNRSEWVLHRQLSKKIFLRIYRPGIVIGDSKTGAVEKLDGPYLLLGTLLQAKKLIGDRAAYLPLPYDENSLLPIIPVDELVGRLCQLIEKPNKEHPSRTYHLVPENPVTFTGLLQWLCPQLGLNLKIVRVSPKLLPKTLERFIFRTLKLPASAGNFLRMSQTFSTDNLKSDFPGLTYSHKLVSTKTPWIEKALKYRTERGDSA